MDSLKIQSTRYDVGYKVFKDVSVMLSVYKYGYTEGRFVGKNMWREKITETNQIINLKKAANKEEMRLSLLQGMVECSGAGESKRNLLLLYDDIYHNLNDSKDKSDDLIFLERVREKLDRARAGN